MNLITNRFTTKLSFSDLSLRNVMSLSCQQKKGHSLRHYGYSFGVGGVKKGGGWGGQGRGEGNLL